MTKPLTESDLQGLADMIKRIAENLTLTGAILDVYAANKEWEEHRQNPGYYDRIISGLPTYLKDTAENVTAYIEGEKVEQTGEIIPWPEEPV